MEKPKITKEHVKKLFDSKYVRVYDLFDSVGRPYYVASRRDVEDIAATKDYKEHQKMVADGVSCFVVIAPKGAEHKLLLVREFRYPTGQFLLGVPAGIIDPEDKQKEKPAVTAAIREIKEETGITIKEGDSIELINPLVFSTPGLTDESNALVSAVIRREDFELSSAGAEGTECFDGFELLSKEDARRILKKGCDDNGIYFSAYTWMAMMWFLSGFYQ